MLGELAVFDVGGDPGSWTTNVREAAVSDDVVTLGKDQLVLIAQRLGQRADEIKQARPPGHDMGAVLDVGVGPEPFGPCIVEGVTEEDYRRLFDTNVLGAILTTKEALTHFGPNGGSVINIGSVANVRPTPGSAVYAATKGAIETLTRALAAELGGRRIRVNTLAPGPVDTEATRGAGLIGSEFEKQIVAGTPLGRLGQPDDVARRVFLASDEAGWVTGAFIPASGGLR